MSVSEIIKISSMTNGRKMKFSRNLSNINMLRVEKFGVCDIYRF